MGLSVYGKNGYYNNLQDLYGGIIPTYQPTAGDRPDFVSNPSHKTATQGKDSKKADLLDISIIYNLTSSPLLLGITALLLLIALKVIRI